MERLTSTLVDQISNNTYRTSDGLTQDAFLFVSSITPLINVDLFITDQQGKLLLSWRDDEHCGTGWHIPGGIIRHGESIAHRIQATAMAELGCEVICGDLLKISEIHLTQVYRNHFISLLYECQLPSGAVITNKEEGAIGYLKWFDTFPSIVYSQYVYEDYLKEYFKGRLDGEKIAGVDG